jgi:hypothetical protein
MSIGSIILIILRRQLQLEDRLLIAIDTEINKFKDSCPPKEVLLKTIEIKNNINSGLSNLQNAIKSISLTGITNEASVRAIELLIELTESLPVPNQTTTLGTTNTFAVKLIDLKEDLKEKKGLNVGLGQILTALGGVISSVQAKIDILDQGILQCTEETDIAFQATNNTINDLTENTTEQLFNSSVFYKGLSLEIVFDEQNFTTLKKRFGRATDPRGVVKFKTNVTFSTDSNIIIEELKLLIDNQV